MNKTRFALASSSLALAVLGCQPKTKTKIVEVNKEKVYNFTKDSYGTPVPVPAADSNCSPSRGLNLSNSIILNAYTGVEFIQTTTTIEEDSFVGATQKEIFRQTSESETVNDGYVVSLCRDASTIPALSKEGAALGMKGQADIAYAHYLALQSNHMRSDLELPTLAKINLNAVVNVKLIDRNVDKKNKATEVTSYMTDNAMFSPSEDTSQLISYPQSIETKTMGLLGGVPLWTVPGVFQHEFGHFVFHSVLGDSDSSSYAAYRDYSAKHPDLHLFHQPLAAALKISQHAGLKANLASFQVSQEFFIGSLNEGFADMWAYYSMKQPQDMFNVSCFAKNRNIASDVFYNGLGKKWDTAVWNKAFTFTLDDDLSSPSKDPVVNCSQPMFSDIHIVGALIAHTADAVFTAAALANPTKDASLLKAEMSIAWLQAIKHSEEFDDLGGKASLSRILNLAVGTGIKYLNSADKVQTCEVVKTKFPALISRWKAPKTNNEDVESVVAFCEL